MFSPFQAWYIFGATWCQRTWWSSTVKAWCCSYHWPIVW